jgi:hypothetical protein
MGHDGYTVMQHHAVAPVESPVVHTPGVAAEDGDTEAEAEIDVGPGQKTPGTPTQPG